MSAAARPKILVVDDDERVRGVTCELLTVAGFAVDEAETGEEALRRVRDHPDLIVLDVHLPDLDGFEVCRRLKADPATTLLPILQLSGMFTGTEHKVLGLESGADGYLARPVEAAELVATVRALLRASRAERDLQTSESRRRGAEALADVSRAIAQTLHLEEVGERIVVSLRDLLGVQTAGLFRLDEGTGDMVGVAIAGEIGPAFPRRVVFPRGTGLLGLAVREGRPVHALDVLADERLTFTPELRAAIERAPYRAGVAFPLRVKDRVIGGLFVAGPTGWSLDAADWTVAAAFADQAAVTVENARLFAEAERRRREAEALARLARTLTESLDVTAVAERIVASVAALLPVESSILFLREAGGPLRAVALGGAARAHFQPDLRLLPGHGLSGRVVAEGRTVSTEDVLGDAAITLTDDVRQRVLRSGLRAMVAVPLRAKGTIIGVLSIADRQGRVFPARHVALLETLADQAALALENARLLSETTERLRETEALLAVGQALSLDLTTEEAMRRAARETARAFGADMVGAYFVDSRKAVLRPLAGYHVPEELVTLFRETPFPIAGYAALREAWETRRPVWTPEVMSDPRWFSAELMPGLPPHAALFAPTSVRGEIVGGLFLIWWTAGRAIGPAELRLIEGIAAQVGLALERRLAEETQAKLQSELRQAQKMDAVGRLAGGVAHDFNNLLTVIAGRCELLRSRFRPEDPAWRHADLIGKTAERAARLTHQLLAFSRKQVLRPRVLDLNVVVAGMDRMLRRLIGEDIDLVVVEAKRLGAAKADPGQLEQVVLNLVVNARDAMPNGGRLMIETANMRLDEDLPGAGAGTDAPAGDYVMLAVGDTGVGMDAETQAHLFEPFFTTKGPGKGTGLGLATVYGIVKQSGGYVAVESEPGRGSVFRIYLPRVEESPEALEPATGGRAPRGSETVLVVEDDDALRDLAREILEMHGYTVIDARHPGEALLIVERRTGRIDLLVTDVVMPEMSGRELAERLSAVRPLLKVLYMSGYTDNAIVHHGVLDPGITLIQKPFAPDAFAGKVREVLDGRPR